MIFFFQKQVMFKGNLKKSSDTVFKSKAKLIAGQDKKLIWFLPLLRKYKEITMNGKKEDHSYAVQRLLSIWQETETRPGLLFVGQSQLFMSPSYNFKKVLCNDRLNHYTLIIFTVERTDIKIYE